jgi:DmsE family decaheme c-type cytochrome
MPNKLLTTGALALLLILGRSPSAAAADDPPPQEPPPATATAPATTTDAPAADAAATAACSDCHEQAKQFATNPHARGAVTKGEVSNDACTACHGDGTEHIANGGDKTKITVPRGRAGSDETCMLCHDTATDRMSRKGGMHANSAAVSCLSCHKIHTSNPQLIAKPQLSLCGTCHTQSAEMRNKPYSHHLDRGGMACSSCHEPHGRAQKSERSLALTGHLRAGTAGEAPCVSCHAEKRGPFVFPHAATEVGDCTTCHAPHGSSNPMQLRRANVYQVCIECHSATSPALGSQPPSFHNLSSPRYRNCTTCHTAVHGSNHDPQLLK